MSLDKHSLQTVCSKLTAAVNGLSHLKKDEKARHEILNLAHEVIFHASVPEDRGINDVISFCSMAAVEMFILWGSFDAIPTEGATSYHSLAEKANADLNLVRRVGNLLVANRILDYPGDDQVAHTPRSLLFTNPSPYIAFSRVNFEDTCKAVISMPEFFEKYKRIEPAGPEGCPNAYAFGHPGKNFWDVLHASPERTRNFVGAVNVINTIFHGAAGYDMSWVRETMEYDADRAAFVDVCGAKGDSVVKMCDANPWLPKERCVAQDRGEIITEAQNSNDPKLEGITFMAHDFTATQPVRGAMVYHLRRCLHRFGDAIAVQILSQVSDAMAEDSRFLIVEMVTADPPTLLESAIDIHMMSVGGKERTARNWKAVTEQAGLKILKIHSTGSPSSIIECVKA